MDAAERWRPSSAAAAGGPPPKRRRFSLEPDLEVVVGDEIFRVDSRRLMRASAVFRQMLEAGLREEQDGRVVLHGKAPEEFQEVLRFIDPPDFSGPPAVSDKNIDVLLRWADEYQMEALRDLCEKFLLVQPAGDQVALRVALQYNLTRQTEQCLQAMAADLPSHMKALRTWLHEPRVMEVLGPAICKAARVPPPEGGFPVGSSLQTLWPFVEKAVQASTQVRRAGGGVSRLLAFTLCWMLVGIELLFFAPEPPEATSVTTISDGLDALVRHCGGLAGIFLGSAGMAALARAGDARLLLAWIEPTQLPLLDPTLSTLLATAPGAVGGMMTGALHGDPFKGARLFGGVWAMALSVTWTIMFYLERREVPLVFFLRMLGAFVCAPLAPALGARLLGGEAMVAMARLLLG